MIFGGYRRRGLLGVPTLAICASLAPALAGAPATPPESDPQPTKASIQRFEEIDLGGTIRVVNPFGNIYGRFGGYKPQVEVLGTVQRLDRDLPELEIRATRVGSGLEVVVVAAGETAGPRVDRKDRKDRIDLVVFVPRDSALDLETTSDLIEIKGVKGNVSASSTKGDIRIKSIEGQVRAKTVRGDIAVTLQNGATRLDQDFTTETGNIEVYLWEDANMDVRIATSGEISTDFSLQIEHRRFEEPGKHASAVVGHGGPKVRLTSKRGQVRLLRLQKDFVEN